MKELWEDYYGWLIRQCDLEYFVRTRNRTGNQIMKLLHNTEFKYYILHDDNRAADGINLRHEYADTYSLDGYGDEFFAKPCSVLEMLIALSIRVDKEIIGDPSDPHPDEFFVVMFKNLGLNWCKTVSDADEKLNRWMCRRFRKDGTFGLFPVEHDPRDQRELDIWDQMNGYVYENYT